MKTLKSIFIKGPKKICSAALGACERAYHRLFYIKPVVRGDIIRKRYLIGAGDNVAELSAAFSAFFSGNVQAKINQADLILDHVFDLLGSGSKKLSGSGKGYQPISWHSDFKSGYTWNPGVFYRDIRYGHIKGADIKVPWELSRFQHLNILGQAYAITGDRKYADEFASQIKDWIKTNPVSMGVNWKCTMDVAIRAVNWLVAQEYFPDDVLPGEFWREFYVSIYEHGKFIITHLENRPGFTNNHYIADLTGLFFIALYCPFFKESKRWREFAVRELSSEIKKQVYDDGCVSEASTSYHRLVLELFFYTGLLGERAGVRFPESYKNRVKKMFDFSLYCIKPNGTIPQIGDNDNGRFLIFAKRSVTEHKYLLYLAAVCYRDSEYKISDFGVDEEAFWLFGREGKIFYDSLPSRKTPVGTKGFPDAGWYIMRHDRDYCFISCGTNGRNGGGGHAHNDKLSFEIMVNGEDIIADPGTYAYTPFPDERNKFRSTGYHNTVRVAGCEQNEIPEEDIFSLPEKIKIVKRTLKETSDDVVFNGEILYAGIVHKRTIILDKASGEWCILDSVCSAKPADARLKFHLFPGLASKGRDILIKETGRKIALIESHKYNMEKDRYDYSPEYGKKRESECLLIDTFATQKARDIDIYIRRAQ